MEPTFDITVSFEETRTGAIVETAKFSHLGNATNYAAWLSVHAETRTAVTADDHTITPRVFENGERVN